jgi:carbamoyl-phosphate synthase large subunit
MMARLRIPMPDPVWPESEEALQVAAQIGYPLMFVLLCARGGYGNCLCEDKLKDYVAAAVDVTPERPILIDKFLENAIECEAEALADGTNAFVPQVMEHIELAGIHSGDSACVIPPLAIPEKHLATITEYTKRIAQELHVIGLMNIQYAIFEDQVYVLEANPRASRTVPLVSKVCNIPMARLATELIIKDYTGDKTDMITGFKPKTIKHYGGQRAVFRLINFRKSIRFSVRKCVPREKCWVWRIASVWLISRRRKLPSRSCR